MGEGVGVDLSLVCASESVQSWGRRNRLSAATLCPCELNGVTVGV